MNRVRLHNPHGYTGYEGAVTRIFRWGNEQWADVLWDCPYHPCITPIQTKHLIHMTDPKQIQAAFEKQMGPTDAKAFLAHAEQMSREALTMLKEAFAKGYEAGYEQASTEAAEAAAGASL